MTETLNRVAHTTATEAPGHRQMDASYVAHLATGDLTGGRYALFEVRDAPNGAPPLHRHTREDEAYYILDGEYGIYSGEGLALRATPGTYVHVRQGNVHTYKCLSPDGGRMLVIASPAGLEGFFTQLGEAAESPEPLDVGRVAAIAGTHGIEVVGPPPA
jgi:quercetin dioxygenase-like cupin family protein